MNDSEEYLKRQIQRDSLQQKKSVAEQKVAIASGIYPPSFSMPLSLQFELTGRCNMKCRHCYNRSGDLQSDIMTADRWKEIAKELAEHGGIFECILYRSGKNGFLHKAGQENNMVRRMYE